MQKPKCEIRNPKWFGVVVSSLLVAGVWAADYSLDWSTIDGGGGTSTGGVYSITGTIGQPDAGAMSGGNWSPLWPLRLYVRSLHAVRWSAARRSCQNWKPS